MPRKKKKPTELVIVAPDGQRHPVSGRFDNATANQLVRAAHGKFLPPGTVPYQLLRGGFVVAFYDPEEELAGAGLLDGDELITTIDRGQKYREPNFLDFERYVQKTRLALRAVAGQLGERAAHLPPTAVSGARLEQETNG